VESPDNDDNPAFIGVVIASSGRIGDGDIIKSLAIVYRILNSVDKIFIFVY